MKATDFRPTLEAMAKGKHVQDGPSIDVEAVKSHAKAFQAWAKFADSRRAGEPMAAPSELLGPLP